MDKIALQIGIQANLFGGPMVESGLARMGSAAENMGAKVAKSSATASLGFKTAALQIAGLTMNSVQLIDVMDRMAKGQLDLAKGGAFLAINVLQIASNVSVLTKAHWADIAAMGVKITVLVAHKVASAALTLVEWLRTAAHFAANAVATAGAAVPAMLAALAASAVIWSYAGKSFGSGGIVTGPTVALIGERGPEAVVPLGNLRGGNTVTININESSSPRVTGDAVIDALRRSGVI